MGTGRENKTTAIVLILAQDALGVCPEVRGMAKETLGESRHSTPAVRAGKNDAITETC